MEMRGIWVAYCTTPSLFDFQRPRRNVALRFVASEESPLPLATIPEYTPVAFACQISM
jgi:hypothetical protein